jgi:hypothetical protein
MKMILLCLGLLFSETLQLMGQPLIIKGRVKCMNQSENSTKGAENVIIVPTFLPSKSTITLSQPSGYFELNTGIPYSRLQDKTITINAISLCTDCNERIRRVFVSEDQDRKNKGDNKKYLTIKDWMLNERCKSTELNPHTADSILVFVLKQPDQNLDKVSSASALAGTPAFLNLLTTINPVVSVLANGGDFIVQSLQEGKINYGQFMWASPLYQSANTGFNFSPSRDMSEAVFWNPSAIALARKPNNISLLTNVKNNVKLGGFFRINPTMSIALGGVYTNQDERRKSVFVRDPVIDPYDIVNVDSTKMNLKEFAVYASPVIKVGEYLSFGLTFKSIWQQFNLPNKLFIDFNDNNIGKFSDSSIKKQYIDADVSLSFKVLNSLQLGMNFMNLAGTELYSDAFVGGQQEPPVHSIRSLGIGIVYKWQRFNLGSDLIFKKDGFYDATVGINYVPFNNALLTAGMAIRQMSYSVAFRIKHFRISYIEDQDWMVNERRTGKLAFLNGRIYGGFVFDLD